MLIHCPFCGARPSEEFAVLGDAAPKRPEAPGDDTGSDLEAWYDYVYLRDNPRGVHREFWQHVGGCRAWLVVERDTATHEVRSVELARKATAGREAS